MPARVTPADLRESLKALIELDRQAMAIRTLERVMDDIHDQHAWVELRGVLEETLGLEMLKHAPWLALHARVLRGCRDANAILEMNQSSNDPLLQLERVWALIFFQRYDQAASILETILPNLTGSALGRAYRFMTNIQYEQGGDWKSSWVQVRNRLHGRELGVALLDEAYHYLDSGDGPQARRSTLEAIKLLGNDSYHLAWAQHALGMSYLRENQLEQAELALETAESISRKRRAKAFRARALCGMGSLRRLQGDLALAETHFREAIKHAQEPDDLSEALWGVGHILRLQRNPERALEQYQKALRVSVSQQWIEIHRALAHLMRGRSTEAHEAIARAGTVLGTTMHRLIVAKAELARLEGNNELARTEINDLPTDSLTARDEAALFPELFALLETGQKPQAATTLLIQPRSIEISCFDIKTVCVNGRRVTIRQDSKVAHLFNAMLQANNTLGTEELIDTLWPETLEEDRSRKRRQLWQTARALRDALGWAGALQVFKGVYRLDPAADWRVQSRA